MSTIPGIAIFPCKSIFSAVFEASESFVFFPIDLILPFSSIIMFPISSIFWEGSIILTFVKIFSIFIYNIILSKPFLQPLLVQLVLSQD